MRAKAFREVRGVDLAGGGGGWAAVAGWAGARGGGQGFESSRGGEPAGCGWFNRFETRSGGASSLARAAAARREMGRARAEQRGETTPSPTPHTPHTPPQPDSFACGPQWQSHARALTPPPPFARQSQSYEHPSVTPCHPPIQSSRPHTAATPPNHAAPPPPPPAAAPAAARALACATATKRRRSATRTSSTRGRTASPSGCSAGGTS